MNDVINHNGVDRTMTPEEKKWQEELAALVHPPEHEESPEEGLAEVRAQLASMQSAYEEGVNNA